jgi:hypothetical protein
MNTPFVCREATGAGIAGQQPLLFYLWVFQSSRRFFFLLPLSQSILFSRSSPETMTIPISKWVLLGRSLDEREIMYSLLYRHRFP